MQNGANFRLMPHHSYYYINFNTFLKSDLLDFTNVMRYRSEMSKMVILERIFKNQKNRVQYLKVRAIVLKYKNDANFGSRPTTAIITSTLKSPIEEIK